MFIIVNMTQYNFESTGQPNILLKPFDPSNIEERNKMEQEYKLYLESEKKEAKSAALFIISVFSFIFLISIIGYILTI